MTPPRGHPDEPTGSAVPTDHQALHNLLGAFVLGGLDQDEHRAFTRHLRDCATCQRESAQIGGLPALLALVPTESALAIDSPTSATGASQVALPLPSALPAGADDTTLVSLLDRVRRRRRVRRWTVGLVAATVVLLAGVAGVLLGPVLPGRSVSPVTASPNVAARVVAQPVASSSAHVVVALVAKQWGTQVELTGDGLPAGQIIELTIRAKDGSSYEVASWTGTQSGRANITGACWMKSDQITGVDVATVAGGPIATGSF